MSPRAAWRLAALGFEQVYDYEAGKAGWAATGRVVERREAADPVAADAADASVPTCRLDDDLNEVRAHMPATGWDQCIVLNDQRIVLGRLGRRALTADDTRTVEQAMTEGPSTVRPNARLGTLLERLDQQGLETALVTTSAGRLVGVVRRAPGRAAGSTV